MTNHAGPDGLRRFFGVAFDLQTYRNVAYLLLAFPLGVFYFAILTAGISAGLGLVPVLVGVPVLIAVLAGAVVFAELESRMASALLGVDVDRDPTTPGDDSLVEYVKRLVTDPATYFDVFYLASKFVVGVASFVALVTAASVSVSFIVAPFVYGFPDVYYRVGPNVAVDSLPEALALSALGCLLALLSLHAFNFAARALASYTQLLLGAGES